MVFLSVIPVHLQVKNLPCRKSAQISARDALFAAAPYVLVGDYYIPDLKLPGESRPIGRWGRMHKAFLQEYRPGQYNELLLSGKLWTYLADLNEQADTALPALLQKNMWQ